MARSEPCWAGGLPAARAVAGLGSPGIQGGSSGFLPAVMRALATWQDPSAARRTMKQPKGRPAPPLNYTGPSKRVWGQDVGCMSGAGTFNKLESYFNAEARSVNASVQRLE
ncbi:unnamed protein product [Lepidochelys olivacea]